MGATALPSCFFAQPLMKYPFLDLALSSAPIFDELKRAACEVIESGRYLHGKHTEALEQNIASVCQTKHCVAVSNGLDALRLIFRAYMELGRLHAGDEVIVPANTYIATLLAISDNGLVPVVAEPRADTMNLDAADARERITAHTRAIVPVHLYGTPCCDADLLSLAREHDLLIIEDNAQAIGARSATPGLHGTMMTGGLGHASGMSFYPTKNLGALGDGGAVTTNDDELAATVRALANYGSDRRYHNIYQGLNCRLDEIQAAMLNVKLRHLEAENTRRHAIALAYDAAIDHPLVTPPRIFADMRQVWHQYVIRVAGGQRDAMREYLAGRGVGTDIHYAVPPHLQPCYAGLCSTPLPLAEQLADEVVSLPIAHPITEDAAREIAAIINAFEPRQ